MAQSQLCWTCQNACGGCRWSAHLKPVKGWKAKKVKKIDSGREVETYHITECPQYIDDTSPTMRAKGKWLTDDEKIEIANMHNQGIPFVAIAAKMNICVATVKKYSRFCRENKG